MHWLSRLFRDVFKDQTQAKVCAAALAVVFIAIRLLNLPTFCLDSDEVFSITVAGQPWSGLFYDVGHDIVHPPLFYIVLKLWIAIGGTGFLWLRLLPALFSILSLIPFFGLCSALRLRLWQTNVALALLCFNVDQVFHSQYVRMYSLLFLLSLCSYWAFVKFLTAETRRWRPLLLLGIANVLLVYSHYYGWAVIASEGLYLLWIDRKRLAGFTSVTAIVAACFTPWLLWASHFAQIRGGLKANIGWIPRPNPAHLLGYYTSLTVDPQPALASLFWWTIAGAFFVLAAALLYFGLRKKARVRTALDHWRIPFLLTAAFVPPLASFIFSQFAAESVWGSRHLVICAVPYFILIAIALEMIPVRQFRFAAAALVSAWAIVGTIHILNPEIRVNYEVLAEQMVTREPGPERLRLAILDPNHFFPIGYHLNQHAPGRWDARRVKRIDDVYAIQDPHFWVAYHSECWKGEPLRQLLTERGYRVGLGIWVSDPWHRIIAYPVWRPNQLDALNQR